MMIPRASEEVTADAPVGCSACGLTFAGRRAFRLQGERRCWRCALCCRPLLRRSFATALVVGTILVAINQGALIASGHATTDLFWKAPLTYCVPFCVATWGALSNGKE